MLAPITRLRSVFTSVSDRVGRRRGGARAPIPETGGFGRVHGDSELVATALDAMDDVFYVYDADARLVAWNRRLNDLFELTDEELRGTPGDEFFIDADRPRIREAIGEIFEDGETTVEARVATSDGVVRFQLSGHALVDEGGAVVGFAGIGRDVTEKHERSVHLSLQNDRLTEFANVVSHDLRNPLQVAGGMVEIERVEADSDRLERAAEALDRMGRIIDDVLTAARKGELVEDPVSLPLQTLAGRSWETVDTGDATLEAESETVVEGDPDRLDRLFANLFRNSVEHGDPDVTVRVVDCERGFAVEDDGQGIPVSERERVFEAGISGTDGGTGFGLDIVRGVAEAHGWTVTLGESESGGARFEFDLGLVDADD